MYKTFRVIDVTPTLDTSAYASGDRLDTAVATIPGVVRRSNDFEGCVLQSLTVIDSAIQSQAIDILFFDSLPTVASAANAAIDISDANMLKCIGKFSIAAADFSTVLIAGNSIACLRNIGLIMKPVAEAVNLYMVLVCRSATPTYAATSLKFRFGFEIS